MPAGPLMTAHIAKAHGSFAVVLLLAALATAHGQVAQAQATLTRITGTARAIFPFGGGLDATFTCETAVGSLDPCIGTYRSTVWFPVCSNKFQLAGPVTITGLVAQPGPIRGTITYAENDFRSRIEADGTCTFIPGSFATIVDRYTGTWDGSRGFVTMSERPGAGWHMTSSFSVDQNVPVFPLSVSGKIDGRLANATATIQYRPQDLGTAGSVYVFALAPASRVTGASSTAKHSPTGWMAQAQDGQTMADPIPCVLAQLNSRGQLVAVSASDLQAYVSGVLSGQGAAINVLNGVSTANVAGASLFVGYGTSPTAMMNEGLNRNVISVSGALECHPQAPQTGWWWNPAEGGRGFSIEAQGNKVFMAAYLYDASGRATWAVASGFASLDGSLFTGDLLNCSGGQTLGGPYPGSPRCTSLGTVTLAFSNASRGTLAWPGGTIPIERFNIVPDGLNATRQAGQPQAGWWWNAAESGRGFFIEWQDGWADLAAFLYDDAGNPIWLLSVYATPDARTFSGHWWQYGNGQTLTGAYRPATRLSSNVAPVTVRFHGEETATITLPGGRLVPLTRFRF